MVKKSMEKEKGQPQQQKVLHAVDKDRRKVVSNSTVHFCKCGNRYYSGSALSAHIRKKTQQLQFKCHLCDQRFLWNSLLIQHFQRAHKMEPPKAGEGDTKGFAVSCSFCGAKFSTYDQLYKHRKAEQ